MSEAQADRPDELLVAVDTAKDFVLKAFSKERIDNLGLEEVHPPSYGHVWRITLGFDRKRPRAPDMLEAVRMPNAFLQAAAEATARPQRVYKVVEVDTSIPKALSIANRKDE